MELDNIIEKDFFGQIIKIELVEGEDLYTLEEVGKMLGYAQQHEKKAYQLYLSHIDELVKYTKSTNTVLKGDTMKSIRLARKGVWRLSMFCRTEQGELVRDFLTEVADELDKNGIVSTRDDIIIIEKTGNWMLDRIKVHETMLDVLKEQYNTSQRMNILETKQKQLEDKIEEYLTLTDKQVKKIRDKMQFIFEHREISPWVLIRTHCDFSKLNRAHRGSWNCIMSILNDLENLPKEEIEDKYNCMIYPGGKVVIKDDKPTT